MFNTCIYRKYYVGKHFKFYQSEEAHNIDFKKLAEARKFQEESQSLEEGGALLYPNANEEFCVDRNAGYTNRENILRQQNK